GAPAGSSPETSASAAPAAAPLRCPADMADVGVACIDRYEAPNVAGDKPLLMQSALDGQAWCEARGKRLCRESEWLRACGGPAGLPYPYGTSYDHAACNHDKAYRPPRWAAIRARTGPVASAEVARLDQSEPSGARAGCRSPDGVFDLTGNVAEWVVRTEKNPTNHSHVVKGCYWARCFRPPFTPSCEYVNYMHQAGEWSYEMGFRCCRDVGP
ncbi:MAG: SUMF1/EgtB/PvdO family nonheme iron enzyme, partial [Myxococcales bacterium]|nr:SUMF1/EgtB/PvdO family nonheme iron enzyme [Myxococcales bacterium]